MDLPFGQGTAGGRLVLINTVPPLADDQMKEGALK